MGAAEADYVFEPNALTSVPRVFLAAPLYSERTEIVSGTKAVPKKEGETDDAPGTRRSNSARDLNPARPGRTSLATTEPSLREHRPGWPLLQLTPLQDMQQK